MALISLLDAQLAFGHVALLDHTDFSLEAQERVGLIGRNGTGKSSLLKILAGVEKPDGGTLQLQQGCRIAYMPQEPVLDPTLSVFDTVSGAVKHIKELVDAYTQGEGDLNALQDAIEAHDGWNWEQRVQEVLHRLHLSTPNPVFSSLAEGVQDGVDASRRSLEFHDALVGTLSGGTRKRVALAQALVTRPSILLLDEPTNHLDLESIDWLESVLLEFKGSVVTITHDRSFLDRVATRIVELDRGVIRSYPGNFTQYQALKEDQLQQEAVINAKADRLLAQEEVWIRKGVEARRTRSQSRLNRLDALRRRRQARRDALGSVRMDVAAGAGSGKIVADLRNTSLRFGERTIVDNFSATILRGDKVGLIGANGSGKTTLLRLILGTLQPSSGRVQQGSNLQVAYFDQMRDALDLDASLADFISPGSEWIEIGNQRKHVKSYLSDFLFPAARAISPVRSLSGGERNRLLLARLFARPANVLVLDEPTNDLDIDTLELLEGLLADYAGTIFLVSHDRRFLDNVVTSTIAFEGNGQWREYEGGVEDWQLQSGRTRKLNESNTAPSAGVALNPRARPPAKSMAKPGPRSKLSYKEKKELDGLPQLIDALESEQAALRATLMDTGLYQRAADQASAMHARDASIEEELMQALERWTELTDRAEKA